MRKNDVPLWHMSNKVATYIFLQNMCKISKKKLIRNRYKKYKDNC